MNWEFIIRLPILPGFATALLLARLATRGLSWSGVALLIIALLWFSLTLIDWLVHRHRRQREQAAAMKKAIDEIQSPLSLVFLLEEPRHADRAAVANCVRNAFEDSLPVDEIVIAKSTETSADSLGVGNPSISQFLVRLSNGVYGILISSRPYISEPGAFARGSIRDKRLRTAVEGHQAWLSVDLVSAAPEEPEARFRAYATIGKLLSSMAGPDCLAIYAPELRRCNEFDPALIERLRSGSPLSIFDEPTFEPVIEIEEDNPRMVKAVEEALERWPEFAGAFHKRSDPEDDRFIVKAEFEEGDHSEFMWVAVTGLEGGSITGILMNDPHELQSVHRGKTVTLEIDRLNDWLYPNDQGDAVGGFTLKVLAEDAEERRRRNRSKGDEGVD